MAASARTRNPLYTYSLGYDPASNVNGFSDSVMGQWTFQYDHLNRLALATGVGGSYNGVSIAGKTLSWTYDSFGNRKTQTPSTGAPFPAEHAYYYPASNQMMSNNFTGALTYDAAGNTKFDGVNYYALDAESRVCSFKNVASGDSWTNIYDAGGHRVAKGQVDNGASCFAIGNGFGAPNYTNTVLGQSGEEVSELDSTNTLLNLNVYANGELLATYDRAGLHFPLSDWLGTVRAQAFYTGAIEQTWQSMPFGDGLIPVVQGASEHHYTGQLYDLESGLDYFQARFHSGVMGRFLSPDDDSSQDPFSPQSWNLYSYVNNNPLTNTDPDGHDCVTQTRTSDTSVSVSVSSGGCGSGGGTYVPGTVSSVTAGADGHSIDIGYTPYSDSGAGAVANIGAASNGPKMDQGAVNPEGEGQLLGFAVGGAVGKMAGAAARGVLGWFGAGAGTLAGEAAGEVTAQVSVRVGGLFSRVFQTAAGPIEVQCEITVEGTTAVVKDLLIYPENSSSALDVGYTGMRQGIRGLQQELKEQGFDSMRIESTYRTSGANPGRSVGMTTRLR